MASKKYLPSEMPPVSKHLWRIDKEEGIRWRSYHLDQLQS